MKSRIPTTLAIAVVAAGCGTSDPTTGEVDGGGDGATSRLSAGEVAEVAIVDGSAWARIAVVAKERYLVILASQAHEVPEDVFRYELILGQDGAQRATSMSSISGCSIDDARWRDRQVVDEPAQQGGPPAIGASRALTISTPRGATTITAEVVAVGRSAVVWADTSATHPANLDPTFVAEFLTAFDDVVLPRERLVFGTESDLDGDGRIGLVFSPLTYDTAVAFFSGCDLLQAAGCGGSNGGEFLYLTPPTSIAPPYNTPAAIREILAHELGHLIHFNRKVLRNRLNGWVESAYLIEGIGGLAQDVIGQQAGNLYVAKAGLDGIDDFSIAQTFDDEVGYDRTRDGTLRGGSYLFARWLYDRAGGDAMNDLGEISGRGGPALMRTLLDSPLSVAGALEAELGSHRADLAIDFFTALAMSNREEIGGAVARNDCFRFRAVNTDPITMRQRGANLFTRFHGQRMDGPAARLPEERDGEILGGGVEYILLEPVEGQTEIAFGVKVDPGAMARVRLGRIK